VSLILLLFALFPDARVANLPTGRSLEEGTWQVLVAHRYYQPVVDSKRPDNLLGFLSGPTVMVSLDRRLSREFIAGVNLQLTRAAAGVHAEYAFQRNLRFRAEAHTLLNDPKLENTWLSAGPLVPFTLRRLHLVAFPRLTTNTESLFVSAGLGVKYDVAYGLALGAEAEPVLYRSGDLEPGKLAWNVVLEKELGWHNFGLTIGNTHSQLAPFSFTAADLDITKGQFRIGFNLLRKI
jgi:hypothetical protein